MENFLIFIASISGLVILYKMMENDIIIPESARFIIFMVLLLLSSYGLSVSLGFTNQADHSGNEAEITAQAAATAANNAVLVTSIVAK